MDYPIRAEAALISVPAGAASIEVPSKADAAAKGAFAVSRPAVLVMNPYYSGIGIARCLSRASDVPVIALTSEPDTPGAKSRYFDEVHVVPNGRDEPERLFQRVVEIAREQSTKPVIFPTRDFDILFLHEYREALEPFVLLPQAAGSPILRMMDKLELAAVSMDAGISTPRTVSCRSLDAIEREALALQFPVVIKPRFAYQWRRKGHWEQVGAQKAIIARTPSELQETYRRVESVTDEVILQEYVPGTDSDIVVCCCYMNRVQDMIGYFTGRKLRQTPPLTGTGAVVEAIDVPPILDFSRRLLRAFGYSGLAEIEYKHDKSTDTYRLIEINPRHWDQHELGTLVDVNLTWLAYADMTGLKPVACTPRYEHGQRYKWIAETELLREAARNLCLDLRSGDERHRSRIEPIRRAGAELGALLAGRKVFGLSKFTDPMPGLIALFRLAKDALRSLVKRARRSG